MTMASASSTGSSAGPTSEVKSVVTSRRKNLVGDLVRGRAREERIERARRMLLAVIQLATVRTLGDGFARGHQHGDIFGFDIVACDAERRT